MSDREDDFEDTELRDQFGNPPLSKIGAPNSGPITAQVDQSVRRNDALPWIFVAAAVGFLALGLGIAAIPRQSDMSDRQSEAQAQMLARMQDTIDRAARAEERADLLQYYVMELDAKFVGGGLLKPGDTFAAQMLAREKAKQQQKPKVKKE